MITSFAPIYAQKRRLRYQSPFFADLAHQMHLLAQAFKSYEVDDIACQMYVACAASETEPVPTTGSPLTREVKSVMR